MNRRLGAALLAIVATALVAVFRRRPVKLPEPEGSWTPVHR